ncbi:hypothetical protein PtA15_2A518 [Puccinia triticina]|uniref:Uncharacterized protein n=2 Tax=Puccinia triticina TaxID=208348 RepID=A0ABY7CAJ5_9BASI|nr:uncharacterized protein PtA15_2A518 [Puccinia triticina]WAQ82201.1 hypothetical protein PtA15_2A518 [Puccinia triticina]
MASCITRSSLRTWRPSRPVRHSLPNHAPRDRQRSPQPAGSLHHERSSATTRPVALGPRRPSAQPTSMAVSRPASPSSAGSSVTSKTTATSSLRSVTAVWRSRSAATTRSPTKPHFKPAPGARPTGRDKPKTPQKPNKRKKARCPPPSQRVGGAPWDSDGPLHKADNNPAVRARPRKKPGQGASGQMCDRRVMGALAGGAAGGLLGKKRYYWWRYHGQLTQGCHEEEEPRPPLVALPSFLSLCHVPRPSCHVK